MRTTKPIVLTSLLLACGSGPERPGPEVDPGEDAGTVPCEEGAVEACYAGPDGTADHGPCRPGVRVCAGDEWGDCDGQILPTSEVCDEIDNDCDGQVDDGVCEQRCSGPDEDCVDWQDGEVSPGLVETPEGWLALGATVSSAGVIWPSSSSTGTILKVDTETREVLGAYYTGPTHFGLLGLGADSPSRTAVDQHGNVVVANRALAAGMQASITQVAASESSCVDRDGSGSLETSHGWDDVLPFDEHGAWEDECIVWHTEVGNPGGIARAVAIHSVVGLDEVAVERGWVGMNAESRFLEFDTETGALTGNEAATPAVPPYGAAIDRDGWLWVTGVGGAFPEFALGQAVGRFDTADPDNTFEVIDLPGLVAMRVIVDENDTPWFSGSDVFKYDRNTGEFHSAGLLAEGYGPGVIASDGEGSIWAASAISHALVFRIANDDTLDWHSIETPGTVTFGMAVDFQGQAWAFGFADGTATVIDVETEETEHVLDDCNGPCLSAPYIRGDITGLQRHNAHDEAGVWTTLVEGCPDEPTTWGRVAIDAETPPGSRLAVEIRTSDTLADLAAQPWIDAGTLPADGPTLEIGGVLDGAAVTHGRILALRVRFHAGTGSPVLRRVEMHWTCTPPIE